MEERLVALLRLALKYNATDIHFSVVGNETSIDMRIDGEPRNVKTHFDDYKLTKHLKYMANLDVSNNNLPQTGTFDMEIDGKNIPLRFAIIEAGNNINAVLRILDDRTPTLSQNQQLNDLMQNNCGLILLSGPTGSGKTTTMYQMANEAKNKKVYSIEDPIEIYRDNIVQIQVNEELGLSMSAGIKQILRHDPDVILVGEIRDAETARMAVVAAQTGHLVVATMHSGSAKNCISKFEQFGVNIDNLYDSLLCVSNQRLLVNDSTHEKDVVYEIMDRKEIEYFKEHGENSKNFNSIEKQINNKPIQIEINKSSDSFDIYSTIRKQIERNELAPAIHDIEMFYELECSGYLDLEHETENQGTFTAAEANQFVSLVKDVYYDSSYLQIMDICHCLIDVLNTDKLTKEQILSLDCDQIEENIFQNDDGIYQLDVDVLQQPIEQEI